MRLQKTLTAARDYIKEFYYNHSTFLKFTTLGYVSYKVLETIFDYTGHYELTTDPTIITSLIGAVSFSTSAFLIILQQSGGLI